MNEPDTIDCDPQCPWCVGNTDSGECFDGFAFRCGNCGRQVVTVEYTDMMRFSKVEREPTDDRTGRQRTRSRWRKQGRR